MQVAEHLAWALWALPSVGFSEVMGDADLKAAQALEDQDAAAIQNEQRDWQTQAEQFWSVQMGRCSIDGMAKGAPKRHRTKAKAWLSACDHMLVAMTGSGFKHFVQPTVEAERGPPASWPCITLSIDQGSDGWAGAMWLQRRANVNCLVLFDVSHRAWNDCCLALRDSQMWSTVLLLQVCMNLDHGPWQDGRWHSELVEATTLYQKLTKPSSCPVFQGLLADILRDRGELDKLGEPDVGQQAFDGLGECFARMSIKAAMCRWFGIVDSGHSYLRTWHTRLLMHLFLLAQLGLLSASLKVRFGMAINSGKDLKAGDIAKGTTSKDSDSVRQLRVKCRNSLELVTMILLDPMMYQSLTIILAVLGPVREWHSEQSKRLRSSQEVLTWYTEQSMGKGFEVLRKLVGMCYDDGFLYSVGIGKESSEGMAKHLKVAEDPRVLFEDRLAEIVAGFVVALLSRRLQVLAWYTDGLPGSFPRLLDLEEGPRYLARLRTLYDDWCVMKALAYPFWKKLTARSPFSLVFVQQIIGLARDADWKITPELLAAVRQPWQGLGASKVVEDAWQRERFQEERDSVNRRVELPKLWMCPVTKQVLSGVHRFDEIPYASQPISPGLKDLDVSSMFKPRVREATVNVRDVEGKSSTPPW